MRSIVKFLCFAVVLEAILSGCSMKLTQGDLEGVPLTDETYSFFGNIPFVYRGDSLELSQDLLRAYTKAADETDFPRESCRGEATIKATVKQNEPKSAWNIGLLIPFWPILPVTKPGHTRFRHASFATERLYAMWNSLSSKTLTPFYMGTSARTS